MPPQHPATHCYPLLVQAPGRLINAPSPVPHPRMLLLVALEAAVATIWGDMTTEERAAYHAYTCLSQHTAENLAEVQRFAARVRALVGASKLPPPRSLGMGVEGYGDGDQPRGAGCTVVEAS